MCLQRGGRKRRQGKIEPQVKVVSPVVDTVTGKAQQTKANQAETAVVLALLYFFVAILIEGLLLAGAVSGRVEGTRGVGRFWVAGL